MDGRDEDIWREFKLGNTPASYSWQPYSRIEDDALKERITLRLTGSRTMSGEGSISLTPEKEIGCLCLPGRV